MEIIQERLEREFNIEIVQTAPTVTYEIKMTDGSLKLSTHGERAAAERLTRIEEIRGDHRS